MMGSHVEFVPVCPEVEIGLGVPRVPVRIVRLGEDDRLVQYTTGRDVTEEIRLFADRFLGELGPVEGFVLKGRSPSCGLTDAKAYPSMDKVPPLGKTAGLFGREVIARYGERAVEDEGRLTNFRIREHFLTKVFTLAALRRVEASEQMRELVAFQARHKLLFMAYGQTGLRALGRIVANAKGRPWSEIIADYRDGLLRLFSRPARPTSMINVCLHAFGYVSDELVQEEKAHFLDVLEAFRVGKLPQSVPLTLLGSWVARFDVSYLAQQSVFAPYPQKLVEITDSGKGRGT